MLIGAGVWSLESFAGDGSAIPFAKGMVIGGWIMVLLGGLFVLHGLSLLLVLALIVLSLVGFIASIKPEYTKFGRFPAKPYKRFGAIGFGIISNDSGLKGIDIVFLFWHLTIGKMGKKPQWIRTSILCNHCGQLIQIEVIPSNLIEIKPNPLA